MILRSCCIEKYRIQNQEDKSTEIPFLLKNYSMKTRKFYFGFSTLLIAFLLTACVSPVTLTTWKNPDSKVQISKVVVIPLFEKLEYMKPFEQSVDAYFNKQGLKSIGSLDFLNPNIKYPIDVVKHKCDSLGADGVLVFAYKGTETNESYIPETTITTGNTGFGGYWGGGYWGGGYYGNAYGTAYYGGGYVEGNTATTTTSSGGYWTTTSIIRLKASLYVHGSKGALWTGEISLEDPKYVDLAADMIARQIYSDFKKYGLLKDVPKK
jgi:hypothetical protein